MAFATPPLYRRPPAPTSLTGLVQVLRRKRRRRRRVVTVIQRHNHHAAYRAGHIGRGAAGEVVVVAAQLIDGAPGGLRCLLRLRLLGLIRWQLEGRAGGGGWRRSGGRGGGTGVGGKESVLITQGGRVGGAVRAVPSRHAARRARHVLLLLLLGRGLGLGLGLVHSRHLPVSAAGGGPLRLAVLRHRLLAARLLRLQPDTSSQAQGKQSNKSKASRRTGGYKGATRGPCHRVCVYALVRSQANAGQSCNHTDVARPTYSCL